MQQEEYVQTKRSAVFLMDHCGAEPKFQGCLRVTAPTRSRGDITTHFCFIGGIPLPVSQSRGTPTPFTPSIEGPFEVLLGWFHRRCPITVAVAIKTCYEGYEVAQWDDNIDYVIYFPNANITDEGFTTNITQGMDDTSEPIGATVTLHVDDWQLFEKHTPAKLVVPAGLSEAVTALAYCGGPLCASLSSACQQPYDPGCQDIWVGGNNGMLYLSNDGGNSWTNKSGTGAGQLDLSDALYGQMDVLAIYCDRDVVLVSAENGCIYWSHDGGSTWNTPSDCSQMAVAFADYFKNIFAAGAGLWRSTDGGQTWTQLLSGDFVDVFFNESGDGVAITASEIYLSTDGGVSWRQLSSSGLSGQGSVAFVDNTIWVAGADGMAYTQDQGQSWTVISTDAWDDMLWLSCFVGYRISGAGNSAGPLQYTLDGGYTWWDLDITGYNNEDLNILVACYDRLLIGGDSGFLAELVTKTRLV